MVNLIPRDHWDHRLNDLLRGLGTACAPKASEPGLDLPGLGPCLPARSGRVALVTALKALALPAGARVGVPLFCCPIVFSAIAAAGCVPRFLDVDPATFCLSPAELAARRAGLDALVAVHMFGNVCDVPALRQALGHKPVLEDCAQALGSDLGGQPVGSFGSFAIFSFRAAKYLSVGEGGALFSSRAELMARASEIASSAPAPTLVQEAKHVGAGYLKALLRSKPLYGLIGYRLWNAYNEGKDPAAAELVHLGRVFRTDLALAARRISALPSMVARQRAIADLYARKLTVHPALLCAEPAGAYYNRYLYPITLPSTGQRDRLAALLHQRGIDTMKYLDHVVKVAASHYGYSGDCPLAEQLSKRVLTIPCHYGLTQAESEYICEQVNLAWAHVDRESAGTPCEAVCPRSVLTESRI